MKPDHLKHFSWNLERRVGISEVSLMPETTGLEAESIFLHNSSKLRDF
jgi:hypothetical protein